MTSTFDDDIQPDDGLKDGHARWDDEGGRQNHITAFWMLASESLPLDVVHELRERGGTAPHGNGRADSEHVEDFEPRRLEAH